MKVKIEKRDQVNVIASVASTCLELLLEKLEIGYIIIHNDDGTRTKALIADDGVLCIQKYTEDDPEVQ